MVRLGPIYADELPAWAREQVARNTAPDDPRRFLSDADLSWLLANDWRPPRFRPSRIEWVLR